MKLQTKLIAVKRINSSMARSSFSADEIEKVANLIINAEGIINPIILRQHSLESYEVIDGHFEYHAAVRAKEISLLKGETVQAIILEPDNEETLLEQVNILRGNTALVSTPVIGESTYTGETINLDQVVNLETQFVNLERIFKAQFDELQKSNRQLESRISELATQNSKPNNPKFDISEELVNQIANKVVESLHPLLSSSQPRKAGETSVKFPLDLNRSAKKELTSISGLGEKSADKIIQRREKRTFSCIEELYDIGISEKTVTNNKWHDYLVVNNPNT